jgi:hypothetical protein
MKPGDMPLFPSKRSLLVRDAKREDPIITSKKNERALSLHAELFFSDCKVRLSIATSFLLNNLRKILLIFVIAFFVTQIFAGALTVIRDKSKAPYKRNGVAFGPIQETTEAVNYPRRLPAAA